MKFYTLFDPVSGEIQACLLGDEPTEEEVGSSLDWVEGKGSSLVQFVDPESKELLPRPAMSLTVSSMVFSTSETLSVSGVPEGTKLEHPEGELVIDDGFFEWDTNTPGRYTFTLTNFPYQDEVIHADVTEA